MYMTQHKALERVHEEQKSAVVEAQHALQEVKDRREQIEEENDKMREEIAAWYACDTCTHIMCTCT